MVQCPRCKTDLRPVLDVPLVRRFSFPHVCKQIPKLGPAFVDSRSNLWGRGTDWMPEKYGEFYAKSPLVFAAVKLRADAVITPPLRVYRRLADSQLQEVEADHPLKVLLTKVNPFWTFQELLGATSIYLDLWGSAFWVLKKPTPDAAPDSVPFPPFPTKPPPPGLLPPP